MIDQTAVANLNSDSSFTYRGLSATYSPDDNKLRLYAVHRLDADLYARVKAAGFKWAPKQGFFVAPMWTPSRADLLLELCGDIEDEDKSLVERAEERADRFGDYSVRRSHDAESARKAAAAIADNIPFGQPILVGHHSEGRARRDAARIEGGMIKAIKLWDTADYWKRRAVGALHHAKYKELPAVRARRIKGLEADKRKQERQRDEAANFIKSWSVEGFNMAVAENIAGLDRIYHHFTLALYPRELPASQYEGLMSLWSALTGGVITAEQARDVALKAHARAVASAERWIQHYELRLAYERAMLEDAGGLATDKTGPQVGGGCRCWASPRNGWSYIKKVNKVSVTVEDNWGNGGRNFKRTIPFDKLKEIMTQADVDAARVDGLLVDTADGTGFILRNTPTNEAKEESVIE
ncbi:DUF3560 domain-containing protein (plasmid) [Methylomonas sp. EFPC1]|uniref:DUF3560 domain-containing protein n=1 Tax=Methylomonas sp. EFPC1 TaxID=2812647 RepID=UPI000D29D6D4|nr:DUF3560 domain-containing protein [Methylomonas sp. EFPC1]PPD24607.1 MAG: hydrolase [Methylobacter sp.]QSB03822.1 DUF3560 domain-containing protein [Methylomonas sp. EFPC1]